MGVIQPMIHLGHLQSKQGKESKGRGGDGEAGSTADNGAGSLSGGRLRTRLRCGTSTGTGAGAGARARLGGRARAGGAGARRTGAGLGGGIITGAGSRAGSGLGVRTGASSGSSGSRILIIILSRAASSGSGGSGHGGLIRVGSMSRLGSTSGGLGLGLGGRAGGLLLIVVNLVAREVEERSGGEVLGNGELHLVVGVGVAEVVPEGGGLVEEVLAANIAPVLLGVLHARNGLVPVRTLVGPSGLGDPDGLATGGRDGGLVRLVEELAGVFDAVALAVLIVGVLIHTDEIDGVEDGLVGGVAPDVPGVDVADGDLGDGGALEGLAEVVDEVNKGVGLNTNTTLVLDTGNRVTVEILATDGNTDDEVGQVSAVLLDGLLEGVDLLVDVVSARGPDTKEDLGLGVDGSLESLDGVILGVSLDVGVKSDGAEVTRGGLEVLGSLELGHEVGLELGLSVGEGGARVETKVVLSLNAHGEGTSSEGSGNLHDDGLQIIDSSGVSICGNRADWYNVEQSHTKSDAKSIKRSVVIRKWLNKKQEPLGQFKRVTRNDKCRILKKRRNRPKMK
jgi:hypothetical protein